jgi:hypothetical protein
MLYQIIGIIFPGKFSSKKIIKQFFKNDRTGSTGKLSFRTRAASFI